MDIQPVGTVALCWDKEEGALFSAFLSNLSILDKTIIATASSSHGAIYQVYYRPGEDRWHVFSRVNKELV
jgi:hypothetical protein